MPFYDYKCINEDSKEDIWIDAYFGKFEDMPSMLSKDGKLYIPKFVPPDSEFILKGTSGWHNYRGKVFASEEDVAMCEGQKNLANELQLRKIKLGEKMRQK